MALIHKIIITKEDTIGRKFGSVSHCPLAIATKRTLGFENIRVGTSLFSYNYDEIGTFNPSFEYFDYLKLTRGEIEQFETTLTLTQEL